ncbi:hypothetical protein ABPG75_011956 [Micractinium tetrahymenae]
MWAGRPTFDGLSGSGKSAIARSLEQMLHASGHLTMLLDGSSVRRGLCQDLGFSPEERRERIRRIGEVAKLFADAGEFIEVYVDTPPELCERHDYRGLYSGARAGRIQNVMGVDAPYEPPLAPEIVLAACDSEGRLRSPASLAQSVFDALEQGGYLRDPAIPSLAVCRALQHKHSDGILDYSCL